MTLLKSENHFVSIIVLNYNSKNYLRDCFESLGKLNYPKNEYEVIMADNASTDDSVKYTKKEFSWVKIVRFNLNYGYAEGNNQASKYARGKYIVFLNPDTRVDKNWLLELIKAIIKDDSIAICGSKVLFMDDPKRIQSVGLAATPVGAGMDIGFREFDNGQYETPHYTLAVTGSSILVRKDIFDMLKGFDPTFFAYQEDLDLGYRTWLKGYKVMSVPSSVIYHKYGGSWAGRISPFKIYYCQKNRLNVMFKNFEITNLIKGLIISIFYDFIRITYFLVKRNFKNIKALLKANIDFLKQLRITLKKRREIQMTRKLSDKYLYEIGLIISFQKSIKEFVRLERVE